MSYCPKCGTKVREDMSFCPNCGAALKVEQPPSPAQAVPPAPPRAEKAEKHEKREKEEKEEREKKEKTEKREKREFGYIGSLIGGLILIFVGLMFYLAVTRMFSMGAMWAFFIVIIGLIIIVGAVYAAIIASRRYPEP